MLTKKSSNMESTINQRISELAKSQFAKSKRDLSIKIGIPQSTLESIIKGSEPRYNAIFRILTMLPDISPDWLLLGKGNMLRSSEGTTYNFAQVKTGDMSPVGVGNTVCTDASELARLREENKVLRERCDKLTDKLLNTL